MIDKCIICESTLAIKNNFYHCRSCKSDDKLMAMCLWIDDAKNLACIRLYMPNIKYWLRGTFETDKNNPSIVKSSLKIEDKDHMYIIDALFNRDIVDKSLSVIENKIKTILLFK